MTDHDFRVIARRRVSARAWELGDLLDWAVGKAAAAGFTSVTVACEPAGHRWRVLDQLAAERGLALVCVQPLLVCRAREGEDLTFDKSGPKDAVIISRLAASLHSSSSRGGSSDAATGHQRAAPEAAWPSPSASLLGLAPCTRRCPGWRNPTTSVPSRERTAAARMRSPLQA